VPLASELSGLGRGRSSGGSMQQAPIVIQTSGAGGSASERIWGQLIGYTLTAAGVWISYTIMIHYLPDWAKEMLPVTRAVFDKAVTNLGKGIVNCSEQIMILMGKQEATHSELLEARGDINQLQDSVDRCEDSLETAEATNNKSARGIKLLVRAVATLVPGGLNIAEELNRFAIELDIDPTERGEYLAQQQKNQFGYHSPKSDESRGIPRTPMTRSLSDDEISEISDAPKGPKGKIVSTPPGHSTDVSYLSMYTPSPMVNKKSVLPSSTMSMQKRIDVLLNHGRIM